MSLHELAGQRFQEFLWSVPLPWRDDVHDLAVGVDPDGADDWALQDVLATGVTIGAPPDTFNQQGQNWGLPPWRPDLLAATGYASYRDMLRAVLAHAQPSQRAVDMERRDPDG